MLTELTAEGYQSLKSVTLKLGRFTVVTGATGSGKSSIIRAAQLVAFNARGTSYISRGAKSCRVELAERGGAPPEENWAVRLTRGARGQDSYETALRSPDGLSSEGLTFTKLGGKVPEEVTQLLALSPLNFAGQFDRPYLLAESAGEVARTLGQLTNVTLIFEAAREAARRKAQLAGELRHAEAELLRIRQELPRFTSLPQRLAALRRAQEAQILYAGLQLRGRRLQALLSQHSAAQAQLEAVSAALPAVPDLDRLGKYTAMAIRLRELVTQHEHWEHEADERDSYAKAMLSLAQEANAGHAKLLREAGRCPVCGQEVASEHSSS